jgi:hypothetical protein
MLDNNYLPDEAFAGFCGDLCLHIMNVITEQELLDLFCHLGASREMSGREEDDNGYIKGIRGSADQSSTSIS